MGPYSIGLLLFVTMVTFFDSKAQVFNQIKVSESNIVHKDLVRPVLFDVSTRYIPNYVAGSKQILLEKYKISWPNDLMFWTTPSNSEVGSIRANGGTLIGIARAYRLETDQNMKQKYLEIMTKVAEFLICIQSTKENISGKVDGGLVEYITDLQEKKESDVLTTSRCGVGFVEAFISTGDKKYLEAARKAVEWSMKYMTYPYDYPNNKYYFYSNVNHMASQVEFLARFYSISGEQKYLDRFIQISEEIVAWQGLVDVNDIWPDNEQVNPSWDGSWYWYTYGCKNPPSGTEVNPDQTQQGNDYTRRMIYHVITLQGLVEAYNAIGLQLLPGIKTGRNLDSSVVYLNKLEKSIILALNYIIDNQITESDNSVRNKVYGMLNEFKNNLYHNTTTNTLTQNLAISPYGLRCLVSAYSALRKYSNIDEAELKKLECLINSLYKNSVRTPGWPPNTYISFSVSNWVGNGMIDNVSSYYDFVTNKDTWNNSFSNGNIESKVIGWELWSWNGSGVTVIEDMGNKKIKIEDNDNNAGMWAQQLIKCNPNTSFRLSADGLVQSGYIKLMAHYYDAQRRLITYDELRVYANGLTKRYDLGFKTPGNTRYLNIRIHANWYFSSLSYWDNIVLTKLNTEDEPQDPTDNTNVLDMNINENNLTSDNTSTSLGIYPNPFNSTFVIAGLNENVSNHILIYDVTGRVVFDETIAGYSHRNITIKNISTSVYFVKVANVYGIKILKATFIK